MPIQMPNTIVKHKGYMNYPKLLRTIHNWFTNEEYKFYETKHKYTGGGEGKYEIEFKGERKINEYVKYHMMIVVRTWEVKQVEVVKEGHKTKTYYGRVHINIIPAYDLDWQGRFGGNRFLQELQKFYHTYIIYRDINDRWEDELMLKSVQFARVIKEEFGHEGS